MDYFSTQEPNRSLNPDEAVDMMLQCRAESSQVKVLHEDRTRCYRRDSFAHGLHTVGGVMTKLINTTPPCRGAADDVSLLFDNVNAPIFGFKVHGMVTECNHYRALAVRRPQHLAGE